MMQHNEEGTLIDLINYRLRVSKEDLQAAKLLFNTGNYRAANNRAYYAIFHSIIAVHALDGNTYKRHKDALGNFNKNYIKTEIFPKEYSSKIANAEYIRKSSDYDYQYIASKSVTSDLISTAEELTELIEDYCSDRINNATLD